MKLSIPKPLFLKNLLVLLLMLCFTQLTVVANQPISFHGGSFSDAQTRAAQQNKGVFVEIYASWCGPCKVLEKNVFTDGDVGEFFNKSFVSVKIDIDSPEGKNFQSRYNVSGLPDLLFFDAQGNVLYRQNGLQDKHTLLGMAHRVLNIPYAVEVEELAEKQPERNRFKRQKAKKKRERGEKRKRKIKNPFSKWSRNGKAANSPKTNTRRDQKQDKEDPELIEFYGDSPNNYGDVAQAKRTKRKLFDFNITMPSFLQKKSDPQMDGKVITEHGGYMDVELTEEPVQFITEGADSDVQYEAGAYVNKSQQSYARQEPSNAPVQEFTKPKTDYQPTTSIPEVRRNEWRQESNADRAYRDGERDLEFLRNYSYQLKAEGKPHAEVVNKYLKRVFLRDVTGQLISVEERNQFVYDFSDNIQAGAIEYLLENRSAFYYQYGQDHTDMKIRSTLMEGVHTAVQYNDEQLFHRVLNLARKGKFNDELDLVFSLRASYYKGIGDFDKYMHTVCKFVDKTKSKDPVFLHQFAQEVLQFSGNRGYLKKALRWTETAIASQPNSNNYNTHAQLCYQLGRRDQAYSSARQAIALAQVNGKECVASQELLAKLQGAYRAGL